MRITQPANLAISTSLHIIVPFKPVREYLALGLASQAAVTLGLQQKRATDSRISTSVVDGVSFWACYILDR